MPTGNTLRINLPMYCGQYYVAVTRMDPPTARVQAVWHQGSASIMLGSDVTATVWYEVRIKSELTEATVHYEVLR